MAPAPPDPATIAAATRWSARSRRHQVMQKCATRSDECIRRLARILAELDTVRPEDLRDKLTEAATQVLELARIVSEVAHLEVAQGALLDAVGGPPPPPARTWWRRLRGAASAAIRAWRAPPT